MYRTPTRRNIITPMQAVDIQELGADIRIYGEIDDPAMRDMNPSIAWHRGKLKISLRRCNFAVEPKGRWYFRDGSPYSKTDVILGDLDPDTLQVSNLTKLELSKDSPKDVLIAGLEDVRLFSRKDGLHAVGFQSDRVVRTLHNASASMGEYIIKGNTLQYLRTYEKPYPEIVEKNWCPTDTPTKLFDLTYSDSQAYKDGKLIGEPTKTNIHGGSQLLKQKDGTWLSLTHEKKLDPNMRVHRLNHKIYDKHIYYTYLAEHNEQGIITRLSKGFRFGTHENIEFASGLAEYGDYFIMTAGVRDCKYLICKIEKQKILDLM